MTDGGSGDTEYTNIPIFTSVNQILPQTDNTSITQIRSSKEPRHQDIITGHQRNRQQQHQRSRQQQQQQRQHGSSDWWDVSSDRFMSSSRPPGGVTTKLEPEINDRYHSDTDDVTSDKALIGCHTCDNGDVTINNY